MKAVVTGGTGFTGERVVRLLASRGISVTVVARTSSDTSAARAAGATIVEADLDRPDTLKRAFAGSDTLLHVASMGFGQVPGVITAAQAAGIRRAVFVSTTAVLTNLPVRSKPIRAAAEACVRDSGLAWTIVRPTMIYGSSRDRNMCRLLLHLRRWRVAPLPGRGRALQQPVHVDDVATTIVEAASTSVAEGREYIISGARAMTLHEVIEQAAAAVGVVPLFIPLPTGILIEVLRSSERAGIRWPIRAEQLERLDEDKAFDHAAATRDLGITPRCFSEGIRQQAREMSALGRFS